MFSVLNNFSNKAIMKMILVPKFFVQFSSTTLQLKVSLKLCSLSSCGLVI